MSESISDRLACPVCARPLALSERVWRCDAKHSFDVAREGYVNLLASGHGASRIEGDSADMLHARRRFLARGHYDALDEELIALLHATRPRAVLDVGCGEGHHTARIRRALPDAKLFALDVSRDAIKLAARSYARAGVVFIVGDVKQRIPLMDGAVDAMLDIFAPRNDAEMARVLATGGALVVVIPGERHLAELRGALPLIGIDEDKRAKTLAALPSFDHAEERAMTRTATLCADDIADLIAMTPSARHVDASVLERARGMAPLAVTFDFMILALSKR